MAQQKEVSERTKQFIALIRKIAATMYVEGGTTDKELAPDVLEIFPFLEDEMIPAADINSLPEGRELPQKYAAVFQNVVQAGHADIGILGTRNVGLGL